MIRNFSGFAPQVAPSAYIDPAAQVIGDVAIGERSSIWPCAVLRGDTAPIRIGDEVSIQDNCVLHADIGFPLTIGNRVTVGHLAMVHGCTIEEDSLIGMGASVLTGARIGRGAVVAAGSLVPEGMDVPPDTLVMGVPAKPRRPLEGAANIMALGEAPPAVVDVGLRAAQLIGDGLYGVDIKETENGIFVVEVNDNPNIEHGVEDLAEKDQVWIELTRWFTDRLGG